MKLTQKLIGYLNRAFDKDPVKFLAIRFRYNGASMAWSVADGRLATTVTGGTGVNLDIDLTGYSILALAKFLDTQPGYSVLSVDQTALNILSSLILIDGDGDQAESNGDHLYAYTALLWSYLEGWSRELEYAEQQIENSLKQLSTTSAEGMWLDELGDQYGVPRSPGEVDAQYGPRIIATVLAPANNNIALEMAITRQTGQATTVTDAPFNTELPPFYNGNNHHDSSILHNSAAGLKYGLFDVQYGYDLINGGDIASFTVAVTATIEKFRAAGTQLRALNLSGSVLSETASPPDDSGFGQLLVSSGLADAASTPTESISMAGQLPLADTVTAATDPLTLLNTNTTKYNGARKFDGSIYFAGGAGPVTEHL